MSTADAESAIPPASITGRVGKLVLGLFQLWYSYQIVIYFAALADLSPARQPGVWIFVAVGWLLLSWDINLGLHRVLKLGQRPLWLALGMAALLAAWDWFQTRSVWGPAVAGFSLAVGVLVHTHMGLSHVLAAIAGFAGCEMRVIPSFLTKLRRGNEEAQLHLCPGMWTPIDRWEAKLRGI